MHVANFDKYQMRKIQSTIPSIPGFLEKIRRDPSNIELGIHSIVKYIHIYVHSYNFVYICTVCMPSYVATCTFVFSAAFHSIMWFQKRSKGCVNNSKDRKAMCNWIIGLL